jgi:SAM-dependent methyltransferase
MTDAEGYFDDLYDNSSDPWAYRQRWYEKRKRDLTLASLPRQRYANAFEPACSNGELSLALATRCDRLLSTDFNAQAVGLAQKRLANTPGASVEQRTLPKGWPPGKFDLIVLSEIGYYLSPSDWEAVALQAAHSLTADGTLLACHWLHPIEGCAMNGLDVHRVLAEVLELKPWICHKEKDFILEIWSLQPAGFDLNEVVA